MANLFIVATPIGNMEDITLRALRILKEADVILAEDTRVTRKILDHFEIRDKKVLTLNEHTKDSEFEKYYDMLDSRSHGNGGINLAFVSDAGTPGISDPGGRFVQFICDYNKKREEQDIELIKIIPIPGASSMTALASISGVHTPEGILFLGFPPHKKGRQTFLKEISSHPGKLVIVFESVHRIKKFCEELEDFNTDGKLHLVVGRELTKMFEDIKYITPKEYSQYLEDNKEVNRGEFVIGIYHAKK